MERIRIEPTVPEFKGEETVRGWEKTIENIAVEILASRDKRGILIYSNAMYMVEEFKILAANVRAGMNVTKGPVWLIPGPPREDE